MPPQQHEIDYVCSECGFVTAGPHKDERIPTEPTKTVSYKGSPISHGICEDCSRKFVEQAGREHAQRKRKGKRPYG